MLQPVEVPGDPDSLRRLMVILLDDAVKYSPRGSTIDVRLEVGTPKHASW